MRMSELIAIAWLSAIKFKIYELLEAFFINDTLFAIVPSSAIIFPYQSKTKLWRDITRMPALNPYFFPYTSAQMLLRSSYVLSAL